MPVQIVYGDGGHDPAMPYGNVVEILELPGEGSDAPAEPVPQADWPLYLNDATHPPA